MPDGAQTGGQVSDASAGASGMGAEVVDAHERTVELHELGMDELAIEEPKVTMQRDKSEGEIGDEGTALHPSGEGEDLGNKIVPGNSSWLGAYFNFVNSIVGAGIIGLPFAVQECGFGAGLFLLVLVALFTYYSVCIMIQMGIQVNRQSYEGLCEFCYGRAGFVLVSFFMFVFAFGAMCAYLVIVGDTVPLVLEHMAGFKVDRQVVIGVFAVVIILPLCLLRDMAALSWSSSISIIADAVIVVLVMVRASSAAALYPDSQPIDDELTFIGPNLFGGLGAISFAYVCQHSSFIVFSTLRTPTAPTWRLVNVTSLSSAMALSLMLSLAGYLNFFDLTRSNILNNFGCDDMTMNVGRFLLALTMVFTFPMEQFVTRHSLFAMANGVSPELKGPNRMSNLWHFSSTFALWGAALVVGLLVEDLGPILELTGAFSASVLGYILPSLCFFKINSFQRVRQQSKNAWNPAHPEFKAGVVSRLGATYNFCMPILMLCFGVVAMVAGTYQSIEAVLFDEGNKTKCLQLT